MESVSYELELNMPVSVNGTLVEDKMRRFKGECAHFCFDNCFIYTHYGASAKFSTNSPETDNSATNIYCNVLHCKQRSFPTYFFLNFFLNFISFISYFHLIDSQILHNIYFLDSPPSKYYPFLHSPLISDIISFFTCSPLYITSTRTSVFCPFLTSSSSFCPFS
jgi:hypothetical protein